MYSATSMSSHEMQPSSNLVIGGLLKKIMICTLVFYHPVMYAFKIMLFKALVNVEHVCTSWAFSSWSLVTLWLNTRKSWTQNNSFSKTFHNPWTAYNTIIVNDCFFFLVIYCVIYNRPQSFKCLALEQELSTFNLAHGQGQHPESGSLK